MILSIRRYHNTLLTYCRLRDRQIDKITGKGPWLGVCALWFKPLDIGLNHNAAGVKNHKHEWLYHNVPYLIIIVTVHVLNIFLVRYCVCQEHCDIVYVS